MEIPKINENDNGFQKEIPEKVEKEKLIENWKRLVINFIISGDSVVLTPNKPEEYEKSGSTPANTSNYSEYTKKILDKIENFPEVYEYKHSGWTGGRKNENAKLLLVVDNIQQELELTGAQKRNSSERNGGSWVTERNLIQTEEILNRLKKQEIQIELPDDIKEKLRPKGWRVYEYQTGDYRYFDFETVSNSEKALRGLHVFRTSRQIEGEVVENMTAYYFPENNELPIKIADWTDREVYKDSETMEVDVFDHPNYPKSCEEAEKSISEEKIHEALENEPLDEKALRLLKSYRQKTIELDVNTYLNIVNKIERPLTRLRFLGEGIFAGLEIDRKIVRELIDAMPDDEKEYGKRNLKDNFGIKI